MGIEPTRPAWKAGILPLNYTRMGSEFNFHVSLDMIPYFARSCQSFFYAFWFISLKPAPSPSSHPPAYPQHIRNRSSWSPAPYGRRGSRRCFSAESEGGQSSFSSPSWGLDSSGGFLRSSTERMRWSSTCSTLSSKPSTSTTGWLPSSGMVRSWLSTMPPTVS